MQEFSLSFPASIEPAMRAAAAPAASYLAGGTNIIDLMKIGVASPAQLVDLGTPADLDRSIVTTPDGLRLGSGVTMAQAADHPDVKRLLPAVAESLRLAASPQLRNMATLGGNLLQRTRCGYFRDTDWQACNKRAPGSGCAALDGVNRRHAVLGTSPSCIATYPGDLAVALAALEAELELRLPCGASRRLAVEKLHRLPGDTPHLETELEPGTLITALFVPTRAWFWRSTYLKIRDRQSYDFALASAAVALDLDGGVVREARVGLGGIATKPWRSREAEAALAGQVLGEASARRAADAALADAEPRPANRFRVELARRTLVRALLSLGGANHA